jgi:signal transduction histidine kinase
MRQRLTEVRRLVDRMHQDVHRLIVNLRPSVLDDLGLADAVAWFAERHLSPAGVTFRCEFDLDMRLPTEIETAVFRAVQESIVNIARHARAESVLIQGSIADGRLTAEIEDDGQGFDPASADGGLGSMRGVGLLGMRERIEILGGTLRIESSPGQGTRVLMSVPIVPVGAA